MDKISSILSANIGYLNSVENFESFIEEVFIIFLKCIETKQTLHSIAAESCERFPVKVTADILEGMLIAISDISRLVVKPKAIHQCLLDSGLEPKRSEQFALVWRQKAGDIVEKLKHNTVNNAERLENVDWKLSVQTESSDSRHQKTPFVELNLGLTNRDISFNLNDSQLTNLYDTLEIIQSKLDELHQRST